MRTDITDQQIAEACLASLTMSEAASRLGMHFNTFKTRASKIGCYNPNQGSKGKKIAFKPKIKTENILNGLHPSFQTYKLKKRLIQEGILKNKCTECGQIDEWNDKHLALELDHIDGDRTNHSLHNLRIICPNCHSQTATHRGKKKLMGL